MTRIAVGQLCSSRSMIHNLAQCRVLVDRAAAAGAKALFLPEASDYIARSADESVSLALPLHQSPFVQGLKRLVAQHQLPVHVGVHEPAGSLSTGDNTSLPISHSKDQSESRQHRRVKNTLIWISPDPNRGRCDSSSSRNAIILNRYEKLHLFDVDLPSSNPQQEQTTTSLRESASVEAGRHLPTTFAPALFSPPPDPKLPSSDLSSTSPRRPTEETLGHIGPLICFDLRFPLVSNYLTSSPGGGAEILTYPSAFTVPTGQAGHWEILLRARAIEGQCFVIAAAQVGEHNFTDGDSKRASYGHSMVIDPWGTIVAEGGGIEGWRAQRALHEGHEGSEGEVGSEGDVGWQTELLVVDIDVARAVGEVRRERMPLKPRDDVLKLVAVRESDHS